MEPLIRKSTHDLAMLVAQNFCSAGLSEEVEAHFLQKKDRVIPAIQRGFVLPGNGEKDLKVIEILPPEPQIEIPNLTSTGPSFGEWLKAREEIHRALTGETTVFTDMFEIDEATLKRTDIIPFFRPAGATNRLAVEWKMKLGMPKPYEEIDVMGYKNSQGPELPILGYTNRSVRPDENTLGKENAKSPRDLRKVKMKSGQSWLNLWCWSDTDNVLFLIKGEHLDTETWNWFPEDELPDGRVACGHSYGGRSRFSCHDADRCTPDFGARLATFFKLKPKT